tara:strand:- start:503 stop:2203 length:1701 start_codon:yes stop_codon:yes gene_type:complete
MAKAYIRLTNRVDAFKDEFNNLTNKVGDISTLTTGGFVGKGSGPLSVKTFSGADSSAIEAINEVDYRLDSMDQLLDQAVKVASNVSFNELLVKSGDFTIDSSGNTVIAGTLGVTGVVTADGGIDVDNMHIDDSAITASGGDFTLSAGGDVYIKPTGDEVFFQGITSGEQIRLNLGETNQSILASDSLTLDAVSNISLDAGASGNVILKDDGTQYAQFKKSSNNLQIASGTSADANAVTFAADGGKADANFHGHVTFDSDITVVGNVIVQGVQKLTAPTLLLMDGTSSSLNPNTADLDGGITLRRGTQDSAVALWDEGLDYWVIGTTGDKEQVARHTDAVTFASVDVDDITINANTITRASGALTLATTTSGDIKLEPVGGDVFFTTDSAGRQMKFTMGTSTQTITTSDALVLDAVGDITLDADGGDVFLKDAGTTFGSLTNTSGNLIIKSGTTTAATFSGANVTFAGTITGGSLNTTASDLVGAINELKAQETTQPRSVLSGGNSITYNSGNGEIAVTNNSIAVAEMAGIDSNGTKYRALASNGSGNFIWGRKVPGIYDSDGTLLN